MTRYQQREVKKRLKLSSRVKAEPRNQDSLLPLNFKIQMEKGIINLPVSPALRGTGSRISIENMGDKH